MGIKMVQAKVCDLDGEIAATAISWKSASGTRVNDLCQRHYDMLLKSSHAPTRGRKAGTKVVSKRAPVKRRPKKR